MAFDTEGVKKRLEMLGCSKLNDPAISFAVDKVTNLIKLNCNIDEVPEELHEVAIDIACGEYLLALKSTGQSAGDIIDNLPKAIKAISDGDTKVDFSISESTDQEALFNSFVRYLLSRREGFVHYRRLTW